MKRLNRIVSSALIVGIVLLSACNLGAMPEGTSEPGARPSLPSELNRLS